METLLDKIEEIRLLNIASERIKITKQIKDFEDVISEFGFQKKKFLKMQKVLRLSDTIQ